MKDKCVRLIDVGCTAEQDFQNQIYDKSDVRIALYPRIPGGKPIGRVTPDGKNLNEFTRDTVILASPKRGKEMRLSVRTEPW